jgi:hypothetical protein
VTLGWRGGTSRVCDAFSLKLRIRQSENAGHGLPAGVNEQIWVLWLSTPIFDVLNCGEMSRKIIKNSLSRVNRRLRLR